MPLYADSPQFTNAPKSNFFTGSKGGFQNIPKFNQQQSSITSDILQQAMQLLQNPEQSAMGQNAINQFNTQTVPGLSERFTAMGGGQRSSAFQGAIGSAGAGLQQQLAAMGHQQALPLLQLGLQPQYQTAHMPAQGGFLQSIAGPLLQALLQGGLGAATGGLSGIGAGTGALAGLLGGGSGGNNQDLIKLLMSGG